VHAELTKGLGIKVSHGTVALLMRRLRAANIQGITGRRKRHYVPPQTTAKDLVDRAFSRDLPNQLWVTDITEHPTREGNVYCCVVLDACSNMAVGWAIDSSANTALVVNALTMAIERRCTTNETVIHSDHGVQFTSWGFSERAVNYGLLPSMGTIGDCFDNAVIETIWSRVQVELLDRQFWKTRLQLATAMFDYIEVFHNRQRRHSALGMLSLGEFELQFKQLTLA
jgi:transposase InsO family protein